MNGEPKEEEIIASKNPPLDSGGTMDATRLYLREIGQARLLTAEE